jgi:hypothetical protein
MNRRREEPRHVSWAVYLKVLGEARAAARAAVARLRTLGQHFPSALPEDLVHQLEQGLTDPDGERRKGLRVPAAEADTAVITLEGTGEQMVAQIVERSPGGMALRLNRPLVEGVIVLVRPASLPAPEMLVVEVRHCRLEEGGWVAGCLVVGDPYLTPPAPLA